MKIGNLVRFNHERDGGPVHKVASVMADGMIEIHDMGGYFAPHLFVVADDVAAIPLVIEEATPDDFGAALDTANEVIADLKQRLSAATKRAEDAVKAAAEFRNYLKRTNVVYRDSAQLRLTATPVFERFDNAVSALEEGQ